MKSGTQTRPFGRLPDGRQVDAWRLQGSSGLTLEVITYGGIVTRLKIPDKKGNIRDVVLGYNDLEPYLTGSSYMGATVGRIAGRVSGGIILVEGMEHQLPLNEGNNHLHGGNTGLDRKIWHAEQVDRPDGAASVRLSWTSPAMDENYPGEVEIEVTYTISNDNAFLYETKATSDSPTPVNLTHHGYFNLAGEGNGTIEDHELEIFSRETIATDDQMTLLGLRESVERKACNLNTPKRLGDIIPNLHQQHGDLYWLDHDLEIDNLPTVARLHHPPTEQVMEVSTTLPCLQFYTGKSLNEAEMGKSGNPYKSFAGLCLECEGYPDATRQPGFGDIMVRPGKPQISQTKFSFLPH